MPRAALIAAVAVWLSATALLAAACERVNCGVSEPQPLQPLLQPLNQQFAAESLASAPPQQQPVLQQPQVIGAASPIVAPQQLQPPVAPAAPPAPAPAPPAVPPQTGKQSAAPAQSAPPVPAAVEADAEHQRMFSSWMQTHDKAYKPEHLHTRFNIWRENLKKVNEHNAAAGQTYSLGMTHFADQTEAEFLETHACFLANAAGAEPPLREFASAQDKAAPVSVDWRNKSAVTPVRNQGNCGSCYTFSSAGAVEGAMALAGSTMVPLSVQQILDCSSRYGNAGCNGGLMTSSFSYVKTNKGLCADTDYSYKGKVGRCATSCSIAGGTALAGYTSVPKNQK